MAITVKHGGNPGSTIIAAATAGQAKRNQRVLEKQAQAAEVRNAQKRRLAHQANQASLNRAFQEKQSELNRDSREKQLNADRQFRSNLADKSHGQALERADNNALNQMRSNELEHLRDREDTVFELSANQRDEFNKLSDAYEDAVASGDFTQEELADVRREIITKQAGIEPVARVKKKSPWPKGQGVGETWESSDGRFLLSRDNNGNIKKVAETNNQPTYNDRNEAWKMALDTAQKPILDADGNPTGQMSTDVEQARAFYQEIIGGGSDTGQSSAESATPAGGNEVDAIPEGYTQEAMETLMGRVDLDAYGETGKAMRVSINTTLEKANDKSLPAPERLRHMRTLRKQRETLEEMYENGGER